jgi:hypothetical protein
MGNHFQPYVSSHESVGCRDKGGMPPYFKPGRGKNKGRRVINRVNDYSWLTYWKVRPGTKQLKTATHRIYRRRDRQLIQVFKTGNMQDCSKIEPHRISKSERY